MSAREAQFSDIGPPLDTSLDSPGTRALHAMASGRQRALRHDWTFTTRSATRLFGAVFPCDATTAESYGNVLAAVAMLHGLSAAELRRDGLEPSDPDCQGAIAIRAAKSADAT